MLSFISYVCSFFPFNLQINSAWTVIRWLKIGLHVNDANLLNSQVSIFSLLIVMSKYETPYIMEICCLYIIGVCCIILSLSLFLCHTFFSRLFCKINIIWFHCLLRNECLEIHSYGYTIIGLHCCTIV